MEKDTIVIILNRGIDFRGDYEPVEVTQVFRMTKDCPEARRTSDVDYLQCLVDLGYAEIISEDQLVVSPVD